MNSVAKEIKEYWSRKSRNFQFDSETLDIVSKTMTPDEEELLHSGEDLCRSIGGDTWDKYLFTVNKSFNRHNDIVCRYTTVSPDGQLFITNHSSITELPIKVGTLAACNKNCIYHICDFEKDLLQSLSLAAIADLTSAIVVYNSEHEI